MANKGIYIAPTNLSPEVNFAPEHNILSIKGTSAPEDVRALYYPVIEWLRSFVSDIIDGGNKKFDENNPLRFEADLHYFNSSSAKFLYDIFMELKKLSHAGIPVKVSWYYDVEDLDQKEAGEDMALMAEMEFSYIPVESEA